MAWIEDATESAHTALLQAVESLPLSERYFRNPSEVDWRSSALECVVQYSTVCHNRLIHLVYRSLTLVSLPLLFLPSHHPPMFLSKVE